MSMACTARLWLRVIGIAVAVLTGTAVVLLATVFAVFFVGWFSLLVPVAAVVALVAALSRGESADCCPQCGGALSPAVVGAVSISGGGGTRLQAVYTCGVSGHRSWRWADAGAPLAAAGATATAAPSPTAGGPHWPTS